MTSPEDLLGSRMRLNIASLLSIRPRSLGELADLTGISVQGILKHLRRISDAGLLEEMNLRQGQYLRVRKVYGLKGAKITSFSRDRLLVSDFMLSEGGQQSAEALDLETAAEEIMLQRRRIGRVVKRLGRMIRELGISEDRLREAVHQRGGNDELELIELTLLTEEGRHGIDRILRNHYGCPEPARAVAAATERFGSGS